MENRLDYYRNHGSMTTLDAHAAEVRVLPRDLGALCAAIQGVLLHRDIAPFAYGYKFSDDRYQDANLRTVEKMLSRIQELDARPLKIARNVENRLASVCRHYSVLLAGCLREQGVPARARCGFGAYFTHGKFEDHWVGEYWNAAESRWILVDAQLDAVQMKLLEPDFSPLDVPRDRFIVAGQAWQMCRSGRTEENKFGLSYIGESGLWWVAGNLVRDLAALNRMELLPWDVWGLMPEPGDEFPEAKKVLLDRVAEITLANDRAFGELRETYESTEALRVPQRVFNFSRKREEAVPG